MNGIKVVFRSLAAIFILLGGLFFYLYFAKGAGSWISGLGALIMAVAMTILGNNVAKNAAKKEE